MVQRLGVHDVAGRAVDLQAVDIDHDAQVIELVVVGEHERLPAFALFDLTVAQQGVDVMSLPAFGTQRHAAGGGNTWPREPVLMSTPGTVFMLGWPCR